MGSPSFFKIVLQSAIDEKKLLLPMKFVRQHEGELDRFATFSLPDGRTWKMEIVKRKSDRMKMLGRGWSEFTAHYSISHAYLLVFKYKGSSNFHVRIYDPSSCEIEYPTGDPGEFANKYLSPNCSQMKVRDSNSSRGGEWVIRFSWRDRGGLNLGLGWGAFTDDKELETEDVCLFELIKPADCVMKAHIFRASILG